MYIFQIQSFTTKFVAILQLTIPSTALLASGYFGNPWVKVGLPVQWPTVFILFEKKNHFSFITKTKAPVVPFSLSYPYK